jgi:hypothetical protein
MYFKRPNSNSFLKSPVERFCMIIVGRDALPILG